MTSGGWVLLAAIVLIVVALVVAYPLSLIPLGLIVAGGSILSAVELRRLRAIARFRQGESICAFARSFDCRAIDTRILRATYEELQNELDSVADPFPIRRSDGLATQLGIDAQGIEDLACEVAHRAGRSLEDGEANPMWGKVETVGDLVLFLNRQPESE